MLADLGLSSAERAEKCCDEKACGSHQYSVELLGPRVGSKSGVAGVYQLHDWGPEKKAALKSWSDHIAAVLLDADNSNVVSFSKQA